MATSPTAAHDPVARIVGVFEHISPADVPRMGELYTPDAYFKDPFNEVRGVDAIARIFAHMFVALHEPRFAVTGRVVQTQPDGTLELFLTWDFLFRFKRFSNAPQTVRGCSHLRLAADGRIAFHRDYWDVAEELYEKLPVVGSLMRWLKRRANS
jgi:ketosteroid isomerase-like protein